jgi:hypothetical protein
LRTKRIGPEPTYSLIWVKLSKRVAMRSGMMKAIGVAFLPSAIFILVKGAESRQRKVRSSTATSSSFSRRRIWPIGSRGIQRLRLATTSLASTGSPSWKRSPLRSRKVQIFPSAETSSFSTIWRCGSSLSSKPYSVSHTRTEAFRTTYCVPQIGSKFARFACGTKRSTRFAAWL